MGRDGASLVQVRIEADTHTAGGNELGYRARAGCKIIGGVFSIDATFDCDTGMPDILLPEVYSPAACDFQLPFNKVVAGNHLSNRMLHLDTGVDLHKVEPVVLVEEELDGAGVDVICLLDHFQGGLAQLLSGLLIP